VAPPHRAADGQLVDLGRVGVPDSGSDVRLLEALLAGARGLDAEPDAYALCQFSLTPVRAEAEAGLGRPVHSPPHVAATALRSRLAAVRS
jgi:hypothetical protein